MEDGKGLFDKENTYFVIWTTTPWTLPGNVGITIGGEFEYSIVKTNQGKLIIATALVDNVMKEAGIEEYETIKTLSGEELEGVLCKHPFLDRTSRVVLGSDDTIVVELGTGTGAVHTAPGYGKEDYLCGLKNGLEIVVTVDGKGYQTEGAGIFAGLKYDESNDKIIEWLEENKFLLKKQKINHSYPHCWRCKNPIIFRATEQWFCSVDKFKDEAIKAAETVKWIPSWGADRISNMIKERADWCISRQRTWGVPLPIYYCKECGKEYITKESIEKLKTIFKRQKQKPKDCLSAFVSYRFSYINKTLSRCCSSTRRNRRDWVRRFSQTRNSVCEARLQGGSRPRRICATDVDQARIRTTNPSCATRLCHRREEDDRSATATLFRCRFSSWFSLCVRDTAQANRFWLRREYTEVARPCMRFHTGLF